MAMVKLYNGIEIPQLCMGANIIHAGSGNEDAYLKEYEFYKYAIESGECTFFDTSAAYGRNDEALAAAIVETKSRQSVKIMSKVSNEQQLAGDIRKAFEGHLKYLKTDYIDVYLLHWPIVGTFIDTYKEMEKLYEEGLVKAIGVANCDIHHLKELAFCTNIKPMVNQFEITPVFTQDTLVNYCKAFDIMPIAYTALGRMHDVLIKGEPLRIISEKYGKKPAQIIIKWNEQLGRVAVVKTRSKFHFYENFEDIQNFKLTEQELCWISSMNDNIRLRFNSDRADMKLCFNW